MVTTVRAERRLAAIMAADIVGYSRLIEQDEARTLAAIKDLRVAMIEPLLAEHHGRVVKLMGDGTLAEFASVVDAVACAIALQHDAAVRQADTPPEQRIIFRIGINLGDVVVEGSDLLGDGVNVAARLEQLCVPGGVLVSGTAYDHLAGRLGLPLEFAGEQHVKNRAQPVRTYRVRLDGKAPRTRRLLRWPRHLVVTAAAILFAAIVGSAALLLRLPAPASDRPSLAVLPFVNMSGDPSQDYLGAGVAEEIITVLSSFPEIRVASRTSSFAYDEPGKVQEIAQELGVRYILEGSVRRSGDEVRVTAQLVDGTSGEHVWTSRYDNKAGNLLALQEDVANRIYGSLAGVAGAIRGEEERIAWSKSAPSLDEHDYYLRGHHIYLQFTAESNARARQVWQEGLERFPGSSLLRTKLAWTYLQDVFNGRSDDIDRDVETAWQLGTAAGMTADKSVLAAWMNHWLMAYLHQWHGERFERSIKEAEAAVRMVPYDPFSRADLASVLASAGRTDQAMAWVEEAIRSDPKGPEWLYQGTLAWACYLAGRHAEALAALKEMSEPVKLTLAAVNVRLGRIDEARAVVAAFLKERPGYTLRDEARVPLVAILKAPYLDDLRRAGLPEG